MLACVGLSSGGRGVVEQALQQSQVYAATHLRVCSGQIPYGQRAANDPFPSTICLLSADSEAMGSDSAASSGSNPIRLKTSVARPASIQRVTHLRRVGNVLAGNGFVLRTCDPASPLLSGALGTPSACFRCFSQFHREDLGEYPVVQALLDGAVSGAGATHAVPVDPGALDRSLVAQRVQVEAHGGDVQPGARSELDSVDRLAVRRTI